MTDFYQIPVRAVGVKQLDGQEPISDFSQVRDLVQADLAALDSAVRAGLPMARVRFGSNRDGTGCLFVYRVYGLSAPSKVDPVVVGVVVEPTGSSDTFRVSGDVAGEMVGDVLFEVPSCEVTGRDALWEAAHIVAENLTQQANIVLTALQDVSRQE